MPHAAQKEAEAERNPPDRAPPPPPPGGPQPEPQPPNAAPQPGAGGALFRALVGAGADAVVAYTAEKEMQSMVSEAVATQVQPILVEMRQLFAEMERRFAEMERRFAEMERRFAEMEQRLAEQERRSAEQSRKLDALSADVQRVNEVVDAKMDGLRRELRLIWGALGISLTVWLVVLGYLLTN